MSSRSSDDDVATVTEADVLHPSLNGLAPDAERIFFAVQQQVPSRFRKRAAVILAIEEYAKIACRIQKLDKVVEDEGFFVVHPMSGMLMPHPAMPMLASLRSQMNGLGMRLLLFPAADAKRESARETERQLKSLESMRDGARTGLLALPTRPHGVVS